MSRAAVQAFKDEVSYVTECMVVQRERLSVTTPNMPGGLLIQLLAQPQDLLEHFDIGGILEPSGSLRLDQVLY
jgi:hypothetical protein